MNPPTKQDAEKIDRYLNDPLARLPDDELKRLFGDKWLMHQRVALDHYTNPRCPANQVRADRFNGRMGTCKDRASDSFTSDELRSLHNEGYWHE
jgi:hypothetical protein